MSVNVIGNVLPAVPIVDLGITVFYQQLTELTNEQYLESSDVKILIEKGLLILAEGEVVPSPSQSESDIVCPDGSQCNIRAGAIVFDHFSTEVQDFLDGLSVTKFIWIQDPEFTDDGVGNIGWGAGKIAFNTQEYELDPGALGPFTNDRYIIATLDGNDFPPSITLSSQPTSFAVGNLTANQIIVASYDFSEKSIFTWKGLRPEAEDVSYDNTSSLLTSTNVQDALDELKGITDSLILGSHAQNTDTGTNQTDFTVQHLRTSANITYQVGSSTSKFAKIFALSADITNLEPSGAQLNVLGDLVPDVDTGRLLGTGSLRWGLAHLATLKVTTIQDESGGSVFIDATLIPTTSVDSLGIFANPWNEGFFTSLTVGTLNGFSPITINTDLVPNASGTRNLGSSSLPFNQAYVNNLFTPLLQSPFGPGFDVKVDGALLPNVDNSYSLGNSLKNWASINVFSVATQSVNPLGVADVTVGGGWKPAANNLQTLGTSVRKWATVFGTRFIGDLYDPGNTTSIRYFSGQWQFSNDGSIYRNMNSFGVMDDLTSQVDGLTNVFTLVQSSFGTTSTLVFHNGLAKRPTVDYSVSGTTLTMVATPGVSDTLMAFYKTLA